MDQTSEEQQLSEISKRFYRNLYALRIFNEEIGRLVEDYDTNTMDNFSATFFKLLGVEDENITDLIKGTKKIEIIGNDSTEENLEEKTIVLPVDVIESTENINKEDVIVEENKSKPTVLVDKPDVDQVNEILKFLTKSTSKLTNQSPLLRQGALITLIGYFECLESDLLRAFYLFFPNALPSEGKLLSLADLREIGSIEEAERTLINREVDAVLRDSTENQIDYFSNRPKVDISIIETLYFETLMEIIQRRNILVHNNGIVNKTYLMKLSKEYISKVNVKEGEKLVVTGDYLTDAIDCIFICGTIIIQKAWRKWITKISETPDSILSEYTFDLLQEKRWNLVTNIANFAVTLKFETESNLRIIIINQAIALKEQQKMEDMEKLLNSKDWSICSSKFQVALAVLRNQDNIIIPLLKKALAAEELTKTDIEEWPLFKWFRERESFQTDMQELFA